MTTVLYLLMAALVFFVIGYILAKTRCTSGERYLSETPVDPVTADEGSCENGEILAAQKKAREAEDVKLAEAARLAEEKAATEAEAAVRREAEEKAHKEVEEKAVAEKAKAMSEAKNKREKEEAGDAEPKDVDTAEPVGMAPEGLLDAPRNGQKDNLTKIKGIGIKIDEALNGIGIYHFDQIAAWTEENMAWADKALAFPGRARRDDWAGQAKLLAEGKETEFSKRVEKGEVASSKKA